MARLLTVILNWRTPEMTLKAVEAALVALEGIEGALVVVDNASGDGSFERLTAEVAAKRWDLGPQQVRVLQSGHNGGFGAGNNFGIRAGLPDGSRPDYVYILNSDAFPAPGAIRALMEHLERHPATGFAGSFIHGPDGAPHRTAFRFPSILGEFEQNIRFGPVSRLLARHIVAQPLPQATVRVDWLAGASMMMRMDVLDRIGLFDETFFLYFEETDLCRRAARAGWPTDYVVESRVAHIGSVSTGMKTWGRIPQFWLDRGSHPAVLAGQPVALLCEKPRGGLCLRRHAGHGGGGRFVARAAVD
ncbi:MAG: hypothetical protein RL128_1912 [Pseudomonadota bacterium]